MWSLYLPTFLCGDTLVPSHELLLNSKPVFPAASQDASLVLKSTWSIFPQNLPVAFLSQLVTVPSCWLVLWAHFDLLFLSHSNSVGQHPSALLVQCQWATCLPALL